MTDHSHLIADPEYRTRVLRYTGAVRRSAAAKGQVLTEAALVADWRAVDAAKTAGERPIMLETLRLFEAQKREVVRRLHNLDAATLRAWVVSMTKDPLIVSSIFDLQFWNREVAERLAPRVLAALRDGFLTGLQRVAVGGIDFTSDAPRVAQTLREALREAPRMNETTADKLARTVQLGLSEGDSWDALANRIEAAFDEFKGYRALLNARTLGTMGFEAGQLEAFDEAGVEKKRWLSQRDGAVRTGEFDHLEPDGQEVGVSEPFEVSGELLQYPGDPAASMGNRANCRCTSLPILS